MGCPTPTTTTTTIKAPVTNSDGPETIPVVKGSNSKHIGYCPTFFLSCQEMSIENIDILVDKDKEFFSIQVSNVTTMTLKRKRTLNLDNTYLTYFEDLTTWNVWGEAVCMYSYSPTGIRCTFLWNDWNHNFHKTVLWIPETDTYVMGTLPTGDWPSYHFSRSGTLQRAGPKFDPHKDVPYM